jgi:hypothetical protein
VNGGGAAACAGAYALIATTVAFTSIWAWQKPSLMSGLTAGVVLALTVVVPWWLAQDLAAGPVPLGALEAGGALYAAVFAAAITARRHRRQHPPQIRTWGRGR